MRAHLKRAWVIIFGLIAAITLSLLFLNPRPRAEERIATGHGEEQFFRKVAPEVKPLATAYGIKPSVLLAHLALETDYGQTLIFQKYHNAYGLKPLAGQSRVRLYTADYLSGKATAKTASFATYGSWPESLRDYLARLKADEKAYYRTLATTGKIKESAKVLAQLSRRQKADYAKTLEAIVSDYDLTKYDK